MSYVKSKNLLSTNNSKTIKGEKLGYETHILYLAPYNQNSKGINLCSHASVGCANACLFGSGAARFDNVQLGKVNKTEWFLDNRIEFLLKLDSEITKIKNKKKYFNSEEKLIPVIRLNGTSDIPFEKFKIRDGKNIFELHSDIQFYDYTKNHYRFKKELPKNYHLTFSMSEDNREIAFDLLSNGVNVAMVFNIKNSNELPKTYKGYEVINGDNDDLTFLHPKGIILGLKYKKLTGKGASIKNKEALNSDFIINLDESYTLV